eukprot:5290328-Alexandrium_andersonii.AAC.1
MAALHCAWSALEQLPAHPHNALPGVLPPQPRTTPKAPREQAPEALFSGEVRGAVLGGEGGLGR